MTRIACYSVRSDTTRDQLAAVFGGSEFDVSYDTAPCNADHVDSSAAALVVDMDSQVDQAVIDRCPQLTVVSTRSTGMDRLDLSALASRGIAVLNVTGYGDPTVAEFAFGSMLVLVRRLREAEQLTAEGVALPPIGGPGQSRDLAGLTVGVVGTGHIGRGFIRRALAFDMRVLAQDEWPDLADAAAAGYEYRSLPELLAEVDVLTLHAPATPATAHLIGRRELSMAKAGLVLINTSRGSLVDTRAVLAALSDGTLAGAALDVLEGEEFEVRSAATTDALLGSDDEVTRTVADVMALREHPRVLLTHHQAGNTVQAELKINTDSATQVLAALRKR